jgi:SAM-dependent methyltransferase
MLDYAKLRSLAWRPFVSRDVAAFEPTTRFSRRAAAYVKYRPRYPYAVLKTLVDDTGLSPASVIADVGSGTGFSAQMFLEYGCTVYGIEPNGEMRQAGEQVLAGFSDFHSVEGTAEATTLPDRAVDYVVAGQALHWFDLPYAAAEFARILRPDGWVAVVWNSQDESTAFMQAYEELVARYSADVKRVHHRNVTPGELAQVFADGRYATHEFAHAQAFDVVGLVGRTLSSSYMPGPDDPEAAAMIADLHALFARFAEDGRVLYQYRTELYVGRGPRLADLPTLPQHSRTQAPDANTDVAPGDDTHHPH